MPYQRRGKTVYTKKTGKWKKKQTCRSVSAAERALKLLRGLESGSIKPSQVGKGKFAKGKKKIAKKRTKKTAKGKKYSPQTRRAMGWA